MADEGVDAYFGARREHMRWLTGFTLGEGEDKVAGHSGQFLVGADEVVVLADSRYTVQARREAPDASVVDPAYDLAARWASLLERMGARRVALEASVRAARAVAAPGGGRARGRARAGGRRGSRPCGPSSRRTRSSASRRHAPSRTARSRPCSRTSAPASPSTTWRSASSGSSGPAARRRSPSTSHASRVRRRPCRTGPRAIGPCSTAPSSCSTSARRSRGTAAT